MQVRESNAEFQTAAIHFLGVRPDKARYLEAFKTALASDNYKVVATALYSLEGLDDARLLPDYAAILGKFADNRYLLGDLLHRLEDLGAVARPVLEQAAVHSDATIAKQAQAILDS